MPSIKRKQPQPPAEELDLLDVDLLPDLDPALESIAAQALTTSIEPATDAPETPSKRGRGRPKGARNKRTPTPDGDIPPEERYFFQTRVGPANQQPTSLNSFAELGLLSHEDYLAQTRTSKDPHELEKKYLLKLHARAFAQWSFELHQGFSICLYGWGSKRSLTADFAEWLGRHSSNIPKIVVVNGYVQKLTVRHILNMVATAIQTGPDDYDDPKPVRLVGQPQDILDTLLTRLDQADSPIFILVNSLDHPNSPFRNPTVQSILARLSAHDKIHTLCTCDTPTFQLLFPSNLRDSFHLVCHDATTFATYDAETSVVDDVNELLGRKGRRVGGSQGVSFVLKSLPENARSLYRLLLSEILAILVDDDADAAPDVNGFDTGEEFIDPTLLDVSATPRKRGKTTRPQAPEEMGIEYRTLYQKASEEFICSSDMNFRFLLKEFHDHQMVTTRKDAGGTEILGVPLDRSEMETILEELLM